MFLLALLHAVLEMNVGWGTASVIRHVSDWITAATTSLKCHASQVHTDLIVLNEEMSLFTQFSFCVYTHSESSM